MRTELLINSLRSFPAVLRGCVAGLSARDVQFRPTPKDWAVVEILGHLLDEEIDDFRARLRSTLEHPEIAWPPIDPPAAVQAERYIDADAAEILDRFEAERRSSLEWLDALGVPDWSTTYRKHPSAGPMSAGRLLASWADHDILHARQIIKRRHQLVVHAADEFPTDYAGEWGS